MSDDSFSDIASSFFNMDRDALAERYPRVANAFAKFDDDLRADYERSMREVSRQIQAKLNAEVLSFVYHERPWFIMLHVEEPETESYYLNGAITGMIEPVWSQIVSYAPPSTQPSKLRIDWYNELDDTVTVTHISRWEQERCTHRASIGPLVSKPGDRLCVTFDYEGGASWEAVPIPNFTT